MLRAMSKRLAPTAIPAVAATQRLRAPVGDNDDNDVDLSGWELRRAGEAAANGKPVSADALTKTFLFKDFYSAWGFMSRCVPFINATDHHPEWFNVYNRVEVTLTTHDCKGLSERDFALAAEMQRVAANLLKPEPKK